MRRVRNNRSQVMLVIIAAGAGIVIKTQRENSNHLTDTFIS